MSEVVTKGILFDTVLFLIVALVGLSANIWAPGSAFGQWVSEGYNGIKYIAAIIVAEVVVRWIFITLGFNVPTSKK